MRARLKKLDTSGHQSFNLQMADYYHSLNELHYHPEIELIYIIEGKGTLLVGNKIEPVSNGCLLMIGSNIPHMFRFETHTYHYPIYKQGRIELPLKLLTLHFNPEIFGEQFISLPENDFLKPVIKNALSVQQFYGGLQEKLVQMLSTLLNATSYEKIPLLMQLLAVIAGGKEYRFLNTDIQHIAYNHTDETRLTNIYLYTLNNFHRTITLKEVADTVYMVPNAFCRYFKSRANKSYFDFVLEVRVNHACKLLKETDYSMVIVGYESGFTNLSNFNRYFKAITSKTPLQYRKEYQQYLPA